MILKIKEWLWVNNRWLTSWGSIAAVLMVLIVVLIFLPKASPVPPVPEPVPLGVTVEAGLNVTAEAGPDPQELFAAEAWRPPGYYREVIPGPRHPPAHEGPP